ncbi:MAG: NAD(P)-dependent oxidoreductase [Methanomicrobiales archaeon HGW-Methanomicrobiales-1]|jgi:dTDP-4-dehydrorhamnose reductase|nr:MAG: NAD(P)-dependent oxidoreductase [Methanomicrobiales archaeon HGW-Methanomicrobiales-1]
MNVLLLGATGMLGKALYRTAENRNHSVTGAARSGTDIAVDIRNEGELRELIVNQNPEMIINTVAITNLEYCERNPQDAYLINARPLSFLANLAREYNIYLIQISTDNYYTGDGPKLHDEKYPVTLVNEYARTKFLAECLTNTYENSLIVRTNIVGFRGLDENPTFIEWCINTLINKKPAILFDDFYTSSIDVSNFSEILLDIADKKITGLLNISSRDVTSKKLFIESLAEGLNLDTSYTASGSVCGQKGVRHAESLGLDVTKAETILGYRMPGLHEVINKLSEEYLQGVHIEI